MSTTLDGPPPLSTGSPGILRRIGAAVVGALADNRNLLIPLASAVVAAVITHTLPNLQVPPQSDTPAPGGAIVAMPAPVPPGPTSPAPAIVPVMPRAVAATGAGLIWFPWGQSEVGPEGQRNLQGVIANMLLSRNSWLEIQGFEDEPDRNTGLGRRRAQAVKDFLTQRGVAPDRVIIVATDRPNLFPQASALKRVALVEFVEQPSSN